MSNSALWIVLTLQGEKGDAGLPGPTGPQGIPVSLFEYILIKTGGIPVWCSQQSMALEMGKALFLPSCKGRLLFHDDDAGWQKKKKKYKVNNDHLVRVVRI